VSRSVCQGTTTQVTESPCLISATLSVIVVVVVVVVVVPHASDEGALGCRVHLCLLSLRFRVQGSEVRSVSNVELGSWPLGVQVGCLNLSVEVLRF
jgi:hypothetical protein